MTEIRPEQIQAQITDLRHSLAISSDQLHPDMDELDALLLEADLVGMEAKLDYLEDALDEIKESDAE